MVHQVTELDMTEHTHTHTHSLSLSLSLPSCVSQHEIRKCCVRSCLPCRQPGLGPSKVRVQQQSCWGSGAELVDRPGLSQRLGGGPWS